MSKPSDAAVIIMSASVAGSYWLGSNLLLMSVLGYDKFWLGEGQGYEAGMSGFVGGMVVWNLLLCIPSTLVLLGVALLGLMLLHKKTNVNIVLVFMCLFVFSGLVGLAWPCLLWCW